MGMTGVMLYARFNVVLHDRVVLWIMKGVTVARRRRRTAALSGRLGRGGDAAVLRQPELDERDGGAPTYPYVPLVP